MADTEGTAMPERLLITRTTTDDGACLVTVAGEVDLDGSVRFRDVLLSCLGTGRGAVVDLGGVGFMDSSGINALITAHQAAEAGGVWLRLAAPQQAVQRVLQLVGVDALIPSYPTVEAALAA
ncbi:STAS domain-containing protein [Streptomyces sp. NPDC006134]|uniref:STAS domain-containing protein n=1 Tax=Streptomyces sp. NPDC006134 TaxID=3154467 RepID=UPI0033CEAC90